MPPELEAANVIAQYGAAAVFGSRPASVREMRDIDLARRVDAAYRSREASDWAEWAGKHPDQARLLNVAREMYEELTDAGA